MHPPPCTSLILYLHNPCLQPASTPSTLFCIIDLHLFDISTSPIGLQICCYLAFLQQESYLPVAGSHALKSGATLASFYSNQWHSGSHFSSVASICLKADAASMSFHVTIPLWNHLRKLIGFSPLSILRTKKVVVSLAVT